MNPWWGASFAAAASFLTSLMQCISFDTTNLFWLLLLKMRLVTKCYKMLQCHIARIICSHKQIVFDGYYEAVYVTLGLTPTPLRWNVLRYPFGANLPYIAVVYIGNPGLWSVWKSFLWWRAIEHLLSCKMQKTLLCCQRCISPVEGLPAENAKWMDKDCQVPQIKTFPLLLYFPSCAIPIIFNHISRVNRSTVRQWLSK